MKNVFAVLDILQALKLDLILDPNVSNAVYSPPTKKRKRGVINIEVDIVSIFYKESQSEIVHNILHEIGHYLLASKTRRKKKDYGIPASSFNNYWNTDEERAQVIANYLSKKLGFGSIKGTLNLNDDDDLRKWWNSAGKSMVDKLLMKVKV